MTEKEIKELESYIIKNGNRNITGTQLGMMIEGAEWLIKFKKEDK